MVNRKNKEFEKICGMRIYDVRYDPPPWMSDTIALSLAECLDAKNRRIDSLQIAVDACPMATFMTDHQGNCTYVNRAYESLAQTSIDDVRGDGWKRLIHEEDLPEVSAFWANSISNEETFERNYRYMVGGKTIPVHCVAVKLPGKGYVGYVHPTDQVHCKLKCKGNGSFAVKS